MNNTQSKNLLDTVKTGTGIVKYVKISNRVHNENNDESNENNENDESNESNDINDINDSIDNKQESLMVDLTIHDLKDDVQDFIVNSMGYYSVEQLLEEKPNLDGILFTLEV